MSANLSVIQMRLKHAGIWEIFIYVWEYEILKSKESLLTMYESNVSVSAHHHVHLSLPFTRSFF